ncbi:MAG: ribose-5-phosphate isomerase, partial [Pedobacter sp.]
MSEIRIKIAIGGDHAGFEYKELLKNYLVNY